MGGLRELMRGDMSRHGLASRLDPVLEPPGLWTNQRLVLQTNHLHATNTNTLDQSEASIEAVLTLYPS